MFKQRRTRSNVIKFNQVILTKPKSQIINKPFRKILNNQKVHKCHVAKKEAPYCS